MTVFSYIDPLDTVRKEKREQKLAEDNWMLSLLLGENTALSDTQAFDSRTVLSAFQQNRESFSSLISDGSIDIRPQKNQCIEQRFVEALKKHDFIFSGWPEIGVQVAKEEIKDYLNNKDVNFHDPDGSITGRLEALREISAKLEERGKKKIARKILDKEYSIYKNLRGRRSESERDSTHRYIYNYLIREADARQKTESRSVYYNLLDDWKNTCGDKEEVENIRSVVDGHYNTRVARSLGSRQVLLTTHSDYGAQSCAKGLARNKEESGIRYLKAIDLPEFIKRSSRFINLGYAPKTTPLEELTWEKISDFRKDKKLSGKNKGWILNEAAGFLVGLHSKEPLPNLLTRFGIYCETNWLACSPRNSDFIVGSTDTDTLDETNPLYDVPYDSLDSMFHVVTFPLIFPGFNFDSYKMKWENLKSEAKKRHANFKAVRGDLKEIDAERNNNSPQTT